MSISKTDICNMALTRVGASPIVNIDDDTTNARTLSRVYEMSLRSILSECQWNFATKRRLLATSAETMEWYDSGETVIYARPSDCVRIFGTNDDDATWREEGDYVISDTTGLGVRYVYYLDSPSKYPVSFSDALADRLASDIAFAILNSSSKAQAMIEKYEKISLPKARSENAQTGRHQYLKDDAWELAKYNNGSTDA